MNIDKFIKKIDIDKDSFPSNNIYPFNIDIIKSFKTLHLNKKSDLMQILR